MLALMGVLTIWLAAVWFLTRVRYVPRYPVESITIPKALGPYPLTDAEIVDYFLKMDWARRMDRTVPAGWDW